MYKPRKRKKRSKHPPPILHNLELQALAIRERKIYLKELPELSRQNVELFLDIEGNPDKQHYYLIGMLVVQENSSKYFALWADCIHDEERVWRQFLDMAGQYSKAPMYHYGSYESKALTKLAKRYTTDMTLLNTRLINVHHFIYGKVYFPVYSNSLKEIGRFLGANWTASNASGLQTLVWRCYWEKTRDIEYKRRLLTYNEEDCNALKLLTDELSKIQQSGENLSEVEFADKRQQPKTETEKQIHGQLRTILNFSYLDYDKKKISFRQQKDNNEDDNEAKRERQKERHKKLYQKFEQARNKIQRMIRVPQREVCPQCGYKPLRIDKRETKRVIIDLVLTNHGIKKTITGFVGTYEYCPQCDHPYPPPFKHKQNQLYGHGLKSWIAYHRIALRLPYESICESLKEQFKEEISSGSIARLIKDFARHYTETEKNITQHLLESPFIHADETKISIQGVNWYVWVFTDGQHIILKLRETREATIVHELLANYHGVLISDFYSGYDSVQCLQQKCWVHLIGDLNNDLWESPFDTELEKLVLDVKDLLIPIMECIQKYGLKQRHLRKFQKEVEKFYKQSIVDIHYKSDLASKYQKRFTRYRDSLFTFLEQDGIPWHNNPAEWAIRPIAKQRAISSSFTASVIESYLVLLGIRQTCRAQKKSFFKFLFSEGTNLDTFEVRKRR